MAGYELIDHYLELLGKRLERRADREDVLAELRDHLYSSVEGSVTSGHTASAAQHLTLERFGDADLVADALACGGKGPAVPTYSTRSAGSAALAASVMWLALPVLWLISDRLDSDGRWGRPSQIVFVAGALSLIGAVTITLILVLALRERLGGLGAAGLLGIAFVGLAAPATVVASWFVPGWATLLAIGVGAVGIALLRGGVAPAGPAMAFGLAWPIGMAAFSVLRVLEVGSADEWGDYPIAVEVALWLGCVTMAAGVGGLGRWLRSEEPADLGRPDPMAVA